ncbi:MAG: rhamnogalacturonan acetylesterase [Maribacter sp.]
MVLSYLISKRRVFYLLAFFLPIALASQVKVGTKGFHFGIDVVDEKKNAISDNLVYSEAIGYGFDFGSNKNVQFHKNGFTISDAPVYFSIQIPEGNYKVDVGFESFSLESSIILKAESRRLLLDTIIQPRNGRITTTFLINVRTPLIDEDQQIILKQREFTHLNWDSKLTLEFLGSAIVHDIRITPISDVVTIFLAGDSTVTDQDIEPWASWGQFITSYLNKNALVANYAYSGASLSSFKGSHRLEKIASLMKQGDFLMIQFGHNDQKQKGDGDGPWLNYSDLLIDFITVAREKGAIPILLTPVQRRFFGEDGKIKPTHGDYPNAMRAAAKKLDVPLIDLTKITTSLYESWGDSISKKAFVQYAANTFRSQTKALEDNTHFNSFGANEIALCVVQEIKNQDLTLKSYLKKDIPDYNPKNPNSFDSWKLPFSNRFVPIKPEGN